MLRLNYVAAVVLAAASWSSTARAELSIVQVYLSTNVAGVEQPYTPRIGEPYRLTVAYEGSAAAPYVVRFTMADQQSEVEVTDLAAGTHHVSANFMLPLDGEIPFQVELDPYGNVAGGDPVRCAVPKRFDRPRTPESACLSFDLIPPVSRHHASGSFSPRPPDVSNEFYDPRLVAGTQRATMRLTPGKVERLWMMMGAPVSDGWQRVVSRSATVVTPRGEQPLGATPVENETGYPVYLWDQANVPAGGVTMSQRFALELRNERVDADKLRTVTWADLDRFENFDIYRYYTSPEDVIESEHPRITGFVEQVLGRDYRAARTPYDAARKLFMAVLARTSYTYPAHGDPDLRGHTAVGVLARRKGDCGGFSLLLTAVFRNIGIAARTSCGFWLGADAAHCWTELWFPDHGWIVADGAAGNALSESGKFAFYFGNIPDLNRRMALMRGNTFNVDALSTSWLQGPTYPKIAGTSQVDGFEAHTTLSAMSPQGPTTCPEDKSAPSDEGVRAAWSLVERSSCLGGPLPSWAPWSAGGPDFRSDIPR